MSYELNKTLVDEIRDKGILKSPRIMGAFLVVDRSEFVPDDLMDEAYDDMPLPIPGSMTTSQPSTIAFMLELLDPRPGERILEIGTGSGYVTALLAELVGKSGKVYSIESMSELAEFAADNLEQFGYGNINLYTGDGRTGMGSGAPYDKIISGAEIEEIPEDWREQLKNGGLIVTPYDDHVLKAVKNHENLERDRFPYFSFVKLT
ncbi:MAG TPA: protein-L-isoaspartate O-methyltransferase [Candidatus Paceibacterota bacterium]|nr:protein-L-isoaspartate O-methyltransferase [Candidatus Paceibacterota bacterium]